MNKRMFWAPVALMAVLALAAGCNPTQPASPTGETDSSALKGKLVIFHAGSLTVPMKALAEAFQSAAQPPAKSANWAARPM